MDDVERGYSARQGGISDLNVAASAGRGGGRRERRVGEQELADGRAQAVWVRDRVQRRSPFATATA